MQKGKLYQVKMDLALKMERKFSNAKLSDITAVHDGEKMRLYIPEVPIPRGSYIMFLEEGPKGRKVLFSDMVGWIDDRQFVYASTALGVFEELPEAKE
jgi:hypothetical protein